MEKLEKNINITIDYYKSMIEDEEKEITKYCERLKDEVNNLSNMNNIIKVNVIKEYIKQIESSQRAINKYTMLVNELYRIKKINNIKD